MTMSHSESSPSVDISPQRRGRTSGSPFNRGCTGPTQRQAKDWLGSGTEYLAEIYVLMDPEPGPSGGHGDHTKVEAQTGATSQGVATSPKKKFRVPPAVQPVHDVGRGNDGEVNNLASLSFGSGTEYLSETYVLIDSERAVFILVFTTYFLARERSFQIMIEYLLKHRKTSQDGKHPLAMSPKKTLIKSRPTCTQGSCMFRLQYSLFMMLVGVMMVRKTTLLLLALAHARNTLQKHMF
jgi:hypothetical protein